MKAVVSVPVVSWEDLTARAPAATHETIARMMWSAQSQVSATAYVDESIPLLTRAVAAHECAVVRVQGDGAMEFGTRRSTTAWPHPMLLSALDDEATAVSGEWAAAPIAPRGATGELLVARFSSAAEAREANAVLSAIALAFGQCLEGVRKRGRDKRRLKRLESILAIASQWNQASEMAPLLQQIAEAATKLLESDRASIFLWDRPNHTLVGRPALGVEHGELRIPDNTGIVGQVLQTGEARRVGLKSGQNQINRQVDKKLRYETRTLLAVPLKGRNSELFGVFEVINKLRGEFNDDDEEALLELASHAAIALENTQERQGLIDTRRQISEQAAQGVRLIGDSPAIEALRSTVGRVANTELAVLVLGENGTGKEVVSKSIHYLSRRRDQPFIAVNCAAITESLLESELFGHEKGAFTDAHQARPGKFELASGGTLFLDEIGDLSLGGQSKLLRVLEEKVVVRVGGSQPLHTDARVIAATNQNLANMVREKRFREDLYFRLNVVTLTLPPLRERPDDVLILAEYFLAEFSKAARRKPPKLSADARARLRGHLWPGNVRELRNLMERIAYLTPEDKIEGKDVAFILSPSGGGASMPAAGQTLSVATDEFQMQYIEQAIARAGSNMSEAAKYLGLHRSNLYRKMRQLGFNVTEAD